MNALCNCEDIVAKRWALYACANTVLPYWDARFFRDESMSNVVSSMYKAISHPSPENEAKLKSTLPIRVRKHWDISTPPGFFEPNYSDCPADFAGDSIFYAACAFINDPFDDNDDFSAFSNAKECLARVFVERDLNYDDQTDYQTMAEVHLRSKMVEVLSKETAT